MLKGGKGMKREEKRETNVKKLGKVGNKTNTREKQGTNKGDTREKQVVKNDEKKKMNMENEEKKKKIENKMKKREGKTK